MLQHSLASFLKLVLIYICRTAPVGIEKMECLAEVISDTLIINALSAPSNVNTGMSVAYGERKMAKYTDAINKRAQEKGTKGTFGFRTRKLGLKMLVEYPL